MTALTAVTETEALIVGAGPVGLFAVFQLGLQGIAAQVVDVLDEPGGQCAELYPDKPIYDIPGVPCCTGRELTQALLQQVKPFAPTFHWGQQVHSVARQPDGRWLVSTQALQQPSQQFLAATVVIAAGVGAFVPKELKIDGLAAFTGRQLFYRPGPPNTCTDRHVVVLGGEDAAVHAALALARSGAQQAASVTLVHRRDVLQADSAALAELATLRASGRIRFQAGQVSGIDVDPSAPSRLSAVMLSTPDGQTLRLPLDTLLVCQGISPRLGPVAQWGLAMQRKQLLVDPATLTTSEPGIFAVGDVVTYPGKKKLLVCGFHEATLAAFAIAAQLRPEASGVLQYTTSSALLQQRLGVG